MPTRLTPGARQWLASGPLDVEFYGALRGRAFDSAAEAAQDFVDRGMPDRLSPHPLLDFVSLPPEIRRPWRNGRVGKVLAGLEASGGRCGPLASLEDPVAAREVMLRLARRLGEEREGWAPPRPSDPRAGEHPVREDRSVTVVVVADGVKRTSRTVATLLDHAGQEPLEVSVVDTGSPPHVALGLQAALLRHDRVEMVRFPGSISATDAIAQVVDRSAASTVVLLRSDVSVRRGGPLRLAALLDEETVAGVQPVVLGAEDLIVSTGLVVTGGDGRVATSPLRGHPAEDALRLRGERVDMVSEEMVAVRRQDVVDVGGLDTGRPLGEALADLFGKLLELRPDGFRLDTDTLVTARDVEGADGGQGATDGHGPVLISRARRGADELRWSISLPSPPGERGDRWGDTHFAGALARALRRQGQDVVTRRRGAHDAGPVHLDDVVVALRGLRPIPAQPGRCNVLWVISHPDDVDPAELEGYDVVCAASTSWSEEMSVRTGRDVVPLLQATEFALPEGATADSGAEGVVFVGSTDPRRDRRLVLDAVEAGVPLHVYGQGWDQLPPDVWRADYVDNRRLPELYHRYGVVLADHWPDMARHGFVANRVFDAVASGARVISDDVVGLHDVFDPDDVVVARTPGDIAAAYDLMRRSTPGSPNRRPSLTFDDRVRDLRALVAGSGR